MTVDRERGAGALTLSMHEPWESCAPLSGSAAQEGYGLSNRDDTVAVPGGGNGFLAARDVRREQEAGGRGAWSADRSRSKHDGKRGVSFPGADQGNGFTHPCRPLSYMPLDESGRSSASYSPLGDMGLSREVSHASGGRESRPSPSRFAQPPAHSGAGGPVRNSEAGRGEPEALESALGTVEGAR